LKTLLNILLVSLFSQVVFSQTDSVFNREITLKIENFNFNKNNEYFNYIADGYTLIGSQLHPKIALKPHPGYQLELGVFGLYYYGNERYSKLLPTFSLDYKFIEFDLTVGTLHNEDLHRLIAPLMTSETLTDERRIENGSQIRYFSDRLRLDAWLNWETFIFKGDAKHEELVGGVTLDYALVKKDNWSLKVPIQNLFYHHGGQINTDLLGERNTFTTRHSAMGIDVKVNLVQNQFLQSKTYFIQHQSTAIPDDLVFDKGTGFLTELEYNYRHFLVGIGYWKGKNFVSQRGDDMFQSVSKKTDTHYENNILQPYYKGHTEPDRSLILGKLQYKHELYPDLFVAMDFNLFYQNYATRIEGDSASFVDGILDFNYGIVVKYNGSFSLRRMKK